MKFGRRLALSSSDKLQGELEEKQAVSSEEQCGIELCSADRPNPSAAGMSCAPSCMNGVDCVKFCEISFHILIIHLDYSSVHVNKFTLFEQGHKVVFSKHFFSCQIFISIIIPSFSFDYSLLAAQFDNPIIQLH